MIYLDYSATTPVNKEVLDTFNKVSLNYIGNPNSLHKLGVEAKTLINSATEQIADILKIKPSEIIYTSSASEANNLAIKGIALKYQNRGKHIITTPLEHSSIYGPLNYLSDLGFEIDFVNITDNGMIDIDHLKSLIRNDTILFTTNSVNSELGIIQPIEEIGKMLKGYPKCYFHVDMVQSIGKIHIPLDNVDLISIEAHKFYGIKGIGMLIKKDKILLEPLIHGGKSTTVFRSGTPATSLIVSLAKALRLSYINLDEKYKYVQNLNNLIRMGLEKYDDVAVNSPINALPYVINFSVDGIKPETFMHALEEYDIYISTQTACSNPNNISKAVYSVTKDSKKAGSSLRISLSHLTTENEVEQFLKFFDVCYKKLKLK
ncbi:MAG: cysteine desulfurase family protein [Bacilli bacterium]|nr:cysteine desulfurase family protein [Bacilli bacterium]